MRSIWGGWEMTFPRGRGGCSTTLEGAEKLCSERHSTLPKTLVLHSTGQPHQGQPFEPGQKSGHNRSFRPSEGAALSFRPLLLKLPPTLSASMTLLNKPDIITRVVSMIQFNSCLWYNLFRIHDTIYFVSTIQFNSYLWYNLIRIYNTI